MLLYYHRYTLLKFNFKISLQPHPFHLFNVSNKNSACLCVIWIDVLLFARFFEPDCFAILKLTGENDRVNVCEFLIIVLFCLYARDSFSTRLGW